MAARTTTTSPSPTPTTSYPLTTLFIPPATCSTQYYLAVLGTFVADAVLVNGPAPGHDRALKECWPENFKTVIGGGRGTRTFFSPGICPDTYTTASQLYISRNMYAYCCMEGYTLLPEQGPLDFIAKSIAQTQFTDADYDSAVCYQPLPTAIAVEFQQLDGEIYTTDLRKGHSAVHFPIRVKYQASDFSVFPLDAQPTSLLEEFKSDLEPYIRSGLVTLATETGPRRTSSISSTMSGTGTGVLPSETGGEETPDEGRTGTIAIAVGVTVSVIIVLAVAGYLLFSWRRKKNRQKNGGFGIASGPYKQHQNNDSHIGGIQDLPDNTGGIALAEAGAGGWSKGRQ
ncbi:hypothetical protein TWF718_005267 [Orbilia javanica]|uniref:Uncharacterized protein n=1 Tax=Orbilia javanica TaxID=47235 RepID=A0AAN8RE45_9PEZI